MKDHDANLPDHLRWQLRGLRQDKPPGRDLWPGIASRLPAHEASAPPPRRAWQAPVAMVASLLLVVGALTIGMHDRNRPSSTGNTPSVAATTGDAAPATSLARETRGLTLQYQAAFREIGPLPAESPMQPVIEELDRNTDEILDALAARPDSRRLFEQLRRTYARRLEVSQRLRHS